MAESRDLICKHTGVGAPPDATSKLKGYSILGIVFVLILFGLSIIFELGFFNLFVFLLYGAIASFFFFPAIVVQLPLAALASIGNRYMKLRYLIASVLISNLIVACIYPFISMVNDHFHTFSGIISYWIVSFIFGFLILNILIKLYLKKKGILPSKKVRYKIWVTSILLILLMILPSGFFVYFCLEQFFLIDL